MNAPLGAALVVSALLGGAAVARRRWDAVTPLTWWREQRLYRSPRQIIARHLWVPAVAALLIASTVLALTAIGLLIAAALALVALVWLCWRLRRAARALQPARRPYERDDIEPWPGDGDPTGPIPRIALPGPPPEDPDNPRALEI